MADSAKRKDAVRNSNPLAGRTLGDMAGGLERRRTEPEIVERVVEIVPESAIVVSDEDNRYLKVRNVELSPLGAIADGQASSEDLEEVIEHIVYFSDMMNLWIGDLLATDGLPRDFSYAKLGEKLNRSEGTIANWKSACLRVPIYWRQDIAQRTNFVLTFGHLAAVQGIDDEHARYNKLLEAAENQWTVEQLRASMRTTKPRTEIQRFAASVQKWQDSIISLDPEKRQEAIQLLEDMLFRLKNGL